MARRSRWVATSWRSTWSLSQHILRWPPVIRYGMRVESVTRRGLDKLKDLGREKAPFEVIAKTYIRPNGENSGSSGD